MFSSTNLKIFLQEVKVVHDLNKISLRFFEITFSENIPLKNNVILLSHSCFKYKPHKNVVRLSRLRRNHYSKNKYKKQSNFFFTVFTHC